ncbi:460_t:CDS:2, partial [Entrophospora sp. SA101]
VLFAIENQYCSESCKRKDELSPCGMNNRYYYSSSSLKNSRQSSSPSISTYSSPITSPRLNPSRIPFSSSLSSPSATIN